MAIVGFNFNRILVEKSTALKGKVDINNNVSIKEVQETDFAIGTEKQKGIKFSFEFTSKYEPKIGEMNFTGELLYLDDPKTQAEVVKTWKKDKKVLKELMPEILNAILARCNIEALILSRDVNLPPPIPLPKVQNA